jgi:hypothetical protein
VVFYVLTQSGLLYPAGIISVQMEDNIMKNRFYFWLAACLVLLLGISFSVPAKSDDSSRAGFTEADAEYYGRASNSN